MSDGNAHGGLPSGSSAGLAGYTGNSHENYYALREEDLEFSSPGHIEAPEPFIPRRSPPEPPGHKHSASGSQASAYSNGAAAGGAKEPRSAMVPARVAPPPPKKTGLGPGGTSTTLQRSKTTGGSSLPTRKYSDGRPLNSTYLGQLEPVHSTDTAQTNNKSFKGAVNKLFSSMLDSFSGESRSEISAPYNPIHLTHVGFNNETGEFTGLPREWSIMLREAGISKQDQEANPQAVVEVMRFYQENTKHHDDSVWMKMASLENNMPDSDAGRQGPYSSSSSSQAVTFASKDPRGSPPPQLPQIGDHSLSKKPSNINTAYAKPDPASRADQYSPQYGGSMGNGSANPAAHAPYRHQHTNSDSAKQTAPAAMNQLQRAFDDDADQTKYRQPHWQASGKGHYGQPKPQQNHQHQHSMSASSSSAQLKKQQSYTALQQQQQQQQLQSTHVSQQKHIQDQQHALKRGVTLPSNPRDQAVQQQGYPGQPQMPGSTAAVKKQSSNHQLKRVPPPNPYAQQQQPVPQVQQAVYQSKGPSAPHQPGMQPSGVQRHKTMPKTTATGGLHQPQQQQQQQMMHMQPTPPTSNPAANNGHAMPRPRPRQQHQPSTDEVVERLKQICNPNDPTLLYRNF
ncbi:hypothetical protein GGI07_003430, partial [Coemansia sp. Benny D115]